jgi:hypothetical protein
VLFLTSIGAWIGKWLVLPNGKDNKVRTLILILIGLLIIFVGCGYVDSETYQQYIFGKPSPPKIKGESTLKPLVTHEETKEIASIYTSDDQKVLLWKPPKMLVTVTGIILLRMAIDKRFFSRTIETDCQKAIGIKLKVLDKKVNRNRFDQGLTAADSIIPPEVLNALPAKLNREQLLDQRLPKQCTKDKIWFPRDDEGKRWLCIDYKDDKLASLDEIYHGIKKSGGDYEWKEVRGSISKGE